MKSKILGIVLLILVQFPSFAQADYGQNPTFLDRIYTGGGMGFSISRDFTSISVSPIVGYMITSRLSAGVGLTYQYTTFKPIDTSTSNYGFSIFGRYNLTDRLFAYTEYEYLNFEFLNISNLDDNLRQGFSSYLAGLGYAIPIGKVAALYVIGLYNFAWQENEPSPYDSPWVVRGGITASF